MAPKPRLPKPYTRVDKPLAWLAGEIKTPPLSSEARQDAGVLLRRLQRGELLSMPESRPMPSIMSCASTTSSRRRSGA
jgi:hypothetical protein